MCCGQRTDFKYEEWINPSLGSGAPSFSVSVVSDSIDYIYYIWTWIKSTLELPEPKPHPVRFGNVCNVVHYEQIGCILIFFTHSTDDFINVMDYVRLIFIRLFRGIKNVEALTPLLFVGCNLSFTMSFTINFCINFELIKMELIVINRRQLNKREGSISSRWEATHQAQDSLNKQKEITCVWPA